MRISFIDSVMNHVGRRWWAPLVLRTVGPFISKGESVLDIGAGGGWSGELISQNKKANVRLLDVVDLNRSTLPLTLYDGERMPFPNDSFDTSLLLFVLHHCKDPLLVLKEAVRVSRKRIIVHEDTFASPFERRLACTNDFICNSPFFLVNPLEMNMPYNYLKVEEWERVFKELNLKVRFKKVTRHFLTKHVLFVLEKC